MKGTINRNGKLIIESENDLEAFALQKWCKDNFKLAIIKKFNYNSEITNFIKKLESTIEFIYEPKIDTSKPFTETLKKESEKILEIPEGWV